METPWIEWSVGDSIDFYTIGGVSNDAQGWSRQFLRLARRLGWCCSVVYHPQRVSQWIIKDSENLEKWCLT